MHIVYTSYVHDYQWRKTSYKALPCRKINRECEMETLKQIPQMNMFHHLPPEGEQLALPTLKETSKKTSFNYITIPCRVCVRFQAGVVNQSGRYKKWVNLQYSRKNSPDLSACVHPFWHIWYIYDPYMDGFGLKSATYISNQNSIISYR